MSLIQRVQDILLKPKETWPIIAGEGGDTASIYSGYVIYLAAIPAVAAEFQPKCAAFERMNAFVCAHEFEPQKRRQSRLRPAKAAGRGTLQDRADMPRIVKGFPRRAIGILPFRVRHLGMMRHAMIEVVLVHVGIHPDPLLPKNLVVL